MGELIGDNEIQVLLLCKGQGSTQSPTCPSGEENKKHSIHEQRAMLAQDTFPAGCAHSHQTQAAIISAPTTLRGPGTWVCPISFSQAARAERLLTGQPWASPCMEASATRWQEPEIILQAEQPLLTVGQQQVAFLNRETEGSSKFSGTQRRQAATGNTQAPRISPGD